MNDLFLFLGLAKYANMLEVCAGILNVKFIEHSKRIVL